MAVYVSSCNVSFICVGFEELATLGANANVMTGTDSNGYLDPLEITPFGLLQSKLFKDAPDWLLNALQEKPLTSNFHHDSLTPDTYEKSEGLKDLFDVLAYSYDANGVKYIAIIEGKRWDSVGTSE